jgi:hypothetical protein
MTIKELLSKWTKACLKKKNTPVCLVMLTEDGSPSVLSHYDTKTLNEVFRHLAHAPVIQQKTS